MLRVPLATVLARSLAAHGLVEPVGSIAEALESAAGIYGTAPSSHLGLAARLSAYSPADLERQRLNERTVLRVPGMRGSAFLAPVGLAPAFLGLSRPRTVRQMLAVAGLADGRLKRLMVRVEELLAADHLAARELRTGLGADDPGGPTFTLLLRAMAHEGRIVAAEPVGGERATAYRYARMRDWMSQEVAPLEPGAALALVAPLWMRANGPGTVADLAWWAGVTQAQARSALEAMGAREIEVDGLATGPQLATEALIDELVNIGPSRGVVRFLPLWDAWLMARRERSRLLLEDRRPWVVDRSGNVTSTITLDGRIVGTWDVYGAELLVHPFEPLHHVDLEAGAARLRSLTGWQELRTVASARPLDDGGQNAFRAPLSNAAP